MRSEERVLPPLRAHLHEPLVRHTGVPPCVFQKAIRTSRVRMAAETVPRPDPQLHQSVPAHGGLHRAELKRIAHALRPLLQCGDVAVEPFDALLCPLVPEQIRKPLKMEIKGENARIGRGHPGTGLRKRLIVNTRIRSLSTRTFFLTECRVSFIM